MSFSFLFESFLCLCSDSSIGESRFIAVTQQKQVMISSFDNVEIEALVFPSDRVLGLDLMS